MRPPAFWMTGRETWQVRGGLRDGLFPSMARAARRMSTTETFLVAMILIFATPYLLWRLGRASIPRVKPLLRGAPAM